MGHLKDIQPGVQDLLKGRKLFLRELEAESPGADVVIQVCWDDGIDEYGLPVGHVRRIALGGRFGRTVVYWTAHARTDPNHPAVNEVAVNLPDINQAVRAVVRRVPARYS
ncbi:hypothetical protein [Streptomyces canus]|uniref:hypothetical protein n=1 Tax=Streptomyces canus TaxID=58343 RepID=UPI003CF14010